MPDAAAAHWVAPGNCSKSGWRPRQSSPGQPSTLRSEKNGVLLGFARVVYVRWLFSSSSAVAKRRAEVAAAAQAL